jgi:hypothetical protein
MPDASDNPLQSILDRAPLTPAQRRATWNTYVGANDLDTLNAAMMQAQLPAQVKTQLASLKLQDLGGPKTATIGAPSPTAPVTLGDLRDDPMGSLQRIGGLLKQDVTDPKTWLSLAAAYFGPKVAGPAAEFVGSVPSAVAAGARGLGGLAVRGTAAVGDVVSPDVIGVVSPRIGRAVDVAQRVRNAAAAAAPVTAPPVVAPAAPTAPVSAPPVAAPVAGPGASPPVVPVPPAASGTPQSPPSSPTPSAAAVPTPVWLRSPTALQSELGIQARRAGVQLTEPQYQRAESLVRTEGQLPADAVRLVASELHPPIAAAAVSRFGDLKARGLSDEAALAQIRAEQDLATRLGTPSTADVQAAVAARNTSGRWPE